MLTPLPDVHDSISGLLLGMQLSGVQYCRIHVAQPLGLSFDKAPGCVQFHFMGRGSVLLHDASGATMRLGVGDVMLLSQGTPHVLPSDLDTPCHEIASFESAKICDTVASVGVRAEAAPGDALIFSTRMESDLDGMQSSVGMMPEFVHVGILLTRYPEIHPMPDTMEHESCSERAGFVGILAQLVDVVAAFIARGWVECSCGDVVDWVQALRELELSPAIVTLHRDPGHNWSVTELTV